MVRCSSTVRPLSVHCPSPVRPLSVRCPSAVRPLSVRCPSAVRPLSVRCPSAVRPLSVRCSSAVRLFIFYIFIQFVFGQLLRCPHKVYIERKNMQVALVRFRKNTSHLFTLSFSNRGIQCDSRVYAWIVITT